MEDDDGTLVEPNRNISCDDISQSLTPEVPNTLSESIRHQKQGAKFINIQPILAR
jgi:hypothetical protein